MSYQLILTSDTLDIGRQKINSFMQSSAGVWSATSTYSVISLQGNSNSNYHLSNYGFVTGKNNEVRNPLGVFSVIAGGYNNYSNGKQTVIVGGYANKQVNSAGNYNVIIGGKNNNINETLVQVQGRSYNAIIAGFSNTVNGRQNFVTQNNNTINTGRGNTIFGAGNNITKNSAGGSNYGPQVNLIQGNTNTILGAGGAFMNFLKGFSNQVTDASAAFSAHNTLWGGGNKVVGGGSFNFLMGDYIVNQKSTPPAAPTGALNKCIAFGWGGTAGTPLTFSDAGGVNDYQFILGSGGARKIRLRFDSTPRAYMAAGGTGSWQVGSADYGEYFEWHDGNDESQNRAGYFVEIFEGKIRIAQSTNVIGIVSKNPGFVGDSVQDYWIDKHLRDEWGVPLKQKLQKFYIIEDEKPKYVYFDENGFCYSQIPNPKNRESVKIDLVKEQCTFSQEVEELIENPDFDPTRPYIARNMRKEWEIIGLLGKLRVRTKEHITSNAVDVDPNTGMAQNGTKYPILKRDKEFDGNYGIVTILFK